MREYGYDEKILAQYCFSGKQPELYLAFPVHIIKRTISGDHPQTQIPYHRHDFIEISYVLSGRAVQRIDDMEFPIEEGDLCIINKDIVHTVISDEKINVRQIVLKFLPGYLLHRSLENCDAKHLICLLTNCEPYYIVRKEKYNSKKTLQILSNIIEELTHKQNGYDSYVFMLIQQLAIGLFRDEIIDRTILDSNYNHIHIVGQAIAYIEKNFRDDISLKSASKDMNISYSHLSRIFKRQTGWSFTRYVNFVRIRFAEKLIVEDATTITEAIGNSGFNSVSNFNRMYKRFRGYSPSQYALNYMLPHSHEGEPQDLEADDREALVHPQVQR